MQSLVLPPARSLSLSHTHSLSLDLALSCSCDRPAKRLPCALHHDLHGCHAGAVMISLSMSRPRTLPIASAATFASATRRWRCVALVFICEERRIKGGRGRGRESCGRWKRWSMHLSCSNVGLFACSVCAECLMCAPFCVSV